MVQERDPFAGFSNVVPMFEPGTRSDGTAVFRTTAPHRDAGPQDFLAQKPGGGFRAFVCWSYQSGGGSARGEDHVPTTAADYLMMLGVSRLYLDNFDHFQSSWVTQGLRIGQMALEWGCDDMGSIMIEENVVRAAGTAFRLDTERMVAAIEATGRRAVQRDTLYRVVRRF